MAGVARGEPEGMDFAIDLIQKIPAGWPRFATLAAIIAAYLFFPDIMKKLRGGQKEKVKLERMMQFLQVKKLLLELEVFQKEKNLAGFDFPGEARLLAELKETAIAENKLNDKVPYLSRLKLSLLGGGTFLLLVTLLFIFAARRTCVGSGDSRVSSGQFAVFGSVRATGLVYSLGGASCQFSLRFDDADIFGPVGFACDPLDENVPWH